MEMETVMQEVCWRVLSEEQESLGEENKLPSIHPNKGPSGSTILLELGYLFRVVLN